MEKKERKNRQDIRSLAVCEPKSSQKNSICTSQITIKEDTQYTMWVSEASLRYQKRRRKFDDSHRFEINSMRFQPQGKLAVTHNLIHFTRR